MAKKQNKQKLPRLKFVFLGFTFAIIIFSGFFLARLLNSEPPNYPKTPSGVVDEFYSWYLECLDLGSNCDITSTNYVVSNLRILPVTSGMTALCSKDPVESFELNDVKEEGDKALVEIHSKTTTNQDILIQAGLRKTRGIWKIDSITCSQ